MFTFTFTEVVWPCD